MRGGEKRVILLYILLMPFLILIDAAKNSK
nr:MAG TPA: hypothetical protein [Caudoviricetes sp.]